MKSSAAERPLRLLVLYHANYTATPAIRDYLEALRSMPARVDYFNVDQPDPFDFASWDAVFVNFCVTSQARLEQPPAFWPALVTALCRFKGTTIAAVQDEYECTDRVNAFFLSIGVDIVLTNVPHGAVHRVYREPGFACVAFETVRTAYLAEQITAARPLAERPIPLGYRGRQLPHRFGDLGWHKAEVGRRFRAACEQRDIPCDIATDEESRFHGDAWPRFIARCRVMLGSPSGSRVFDFDGELQRRLDQSDRPYAEARDEVLAHDLGVDMGQVSARIFEAVAARTALALIRGNYSGVIEPDAHYVPIEPDYSNIDQVLEQILDVPAMQAMADRAFEHVTADPANHYQGFADRLYGLLQTRVRPRAHDLPCRLSVTDRPLGTDPYLLTRLSDIRRDVKVWETNLRELVNALAEDRVDAVLTVDGVHRVLWALPKMSLPPWVIVVTKPSSEEAAERSLRQAGYRAYLPRYRKVLLPHGGNRKPDYTMRPLFDRLVFVQDWRGWPKTISITGAVGLMSARPGNAQLSDVDVALIMERERAGDFDVVGPRGDGSHIRGDLLPGDHVEFETAFGAKIMGVLEELSPNGKAVVWSMIFERIVRTEVGAGSLSKSYGISG